MSSFIPIDCAIGLNGSPFQLRIMGIMLNSTYVVVHKFFYQLDVLRAVGRNKPVYGRFRDLLQKKSAPKGALNLFKVREWLFLRQELVFACQTLLQPRDEPNQSVEQIGQEF